MKKLLVFVFAVALLGSCSKIGQGEIPNRLEGHWVDEPDYSTNVGSASDKVIIILSDGTANIQNPNGTEMIGDVSVDNGIIVFRVSGYSASYQYSFDSGDLVLERILDNGVGMEGTYEKQ